MAIKVNVFSNPSAKIKIKVADLLRLSKRSKNYSVTLTSGRELTDIKQSKSRGYIDCKIDGELAKIDKDATLEILD